MSEDFEDSFRVKKIGEWKWEGVRPLKLPLKLARGVYGGHTVAQTLLVGMESAPGYVPNSFHSYFIGPGDSTVPMQYFVTELHTGKNFASRYIKVVQKGTVRLNCLVSLTKKGAKPGPDTQVAPPKLLETTDPDTLEQVVHTTYIRNAYPPEFVDKSLAQDELNTPASERWITLFHKIEQDHEFTDPKFNFIGLADLSDSVILTTLARALHMPWNSTINNKRREYDEEKDARKLMPISLNMMHIYHYNAMSLDHHIYFHTDDYENGFDLINNWLTFHYQFRVHSNNRTLVRVYAYNREGNCVATIIQEGLTYLQDGVSDNAKI